MAGAVLVGCVTPPSGSTTFESTSGALLQAGNVTLTVPLPPGSPMSTVALGANGTLLIGGNDQVSEEGSPGTLPTIANAGTGMTSTTQTGDVLAANLWSVGGVFLATGTTVAGSVTTAGTLTEQTGVTVGGPISQQAPLTPSATTISVAFPASSNNVTLQPGASASLPPGAYASVTVNSRATLTLSSGTYYLDSLDIEPQGVVALTGSGPFVINVRTSLTAKGQVTVPGVSPPPTFVLVDAGSADVFLQAEFDGTLIAPNANITLAAIGSASYHGAFFGKSLTLQAGVQVQHRAAGIGNVTPVAECKISQSNGTFEAVFGYNASSLIGNVNVPLGPNNTFTPSPATRGQPTTFLPGRQHAQFMVPFNGLALTWTLDGTRTTASVALPECTPACVQNLVTPGAPQITTPLSTPAPPLSQDESRAMRDSFRWQDTLPVPETFSDGTPHIYYGQIYVNSPETVQALDYLRINYANSPLFEQEMEAYEAQGIKNYFMEPFDGAGQFAYAFIPGAVYNAIRAAALDPTTPEEIVRAFPVRPIPTSDLGLAPQQPCGLQPITQCVAKAANGSLRAVFSYNNPEDHPLTIPVGPANQITGGPAGAVAPEAFNTGAHTAVFAIAIPAGQTVTWTLNGQSASANAATALCSSTIVAEIGVDSFKPFPAPATPSCRYATPAEAQFPKSSLPPAARANTCVSVAYNYLGTVGFQWRGTDSDADDPAYQAAAAAFAVGDSSSSGAAVTPVSTSGPTGSTTTVRSALFGKLFRKAIQAVGNTVNSVVDAGRRGLRAVAGVFVGSTNVNVTINPLLTDTAFNPGTEKQAWGSRFGQPISLTGLEIRANQSVFLSVANLDSNNHAQVKVLNHLGNARICLKLTSGAGFVTGGFLPDDACPGVTVSPSNPTVTISEQFDELNVMAQLTDGQSYMRNVAGFSNSGAEVIVGAAADLIGDIQGISNSMNKNRAFTPCLGFSWANEVEVYLALITADATQDTFSYVDKKVQSGALAFLRKASADLQTALTQQAQLAQLAAQFAGTTLGNQIAAAKAAVDTAVSQLQSAQTAATLLSQNADDFANAAGTAARAVVGNSSTVNAATSVVQQTMNDVNGLIPSTQAALQTATSDLASAATAMDTLVAQAAGSAVSAQIIAVRDAIHSVSDDVTSIVAGNLAVVSAAISAGVVEGAVQLIGGVIAEVFEFVAGGDILLPAAGGDRHNLIDRGIVTHEYGHFTLCNLLDSVAPLSFAAAYDDAAVEGLVSGQSVSATGAVLNEGFADLLISQAVGGTNYGSPISPQTVRTGFVNYCLASDTDCIEHNTTNQDVSNSNDFHVAVLRATSTFDDAFDGVVLGNNPMNGNEWAQPNGSSPLLSIAAAGGSDAKDELVNLTGLGYRDWISHAMNRGTLLREDNMFGGLSDAMIDQGYNYCERCQVFWLHNTDPTNTFNGSCPAAWVGSAPTYDANGATGTLSCTFQCPNGSPQGSVCCPAGTTPDAATAVCDPPCPTGQHFDPVQLTCVNNIHVG